jgi:hypothetical protein
MTNLFKYRESVRTLLNFIQGHEDSPYPRKYKERKIIEIKVFQGDLSSKNTRDMRSKLLRAEEAEKSRKRYTSLAEGRRVLSIVTMREVYDAEGLSSFSSLSGTGIAR